jgi:hypothetical protein
MVTFGSAAARLLCLLRAAPGGSGQLGNPRARLGHWGPQPLPRLLEPARRLRVASLTASDYPGGGQYRIINNTAGSVGPRLALFRDQPPAFNWRAASRSKLT